MLAHRGCGRNLANATRESRGPRPRLVDRCLRLPLTRHGAYSTLRRAGGAQRGMAMLDRTDEIGRLVEPGRVHRRGFTPPGNFHLRMGGPVCPARPFVRPAPPVAQPRGFITTELGRP